MEKLNELSVVYDYIAYGIASLIGALVLLAIGISIHNRKGKKEDADLVS